ncbi:MAG: FecR family protein, partial [Steroidobacteraceae bacterium]
LNTSSVLQVKFAADERRIVLRQGEASFQVAHDEQRPFVVQAGDVSVRAVGTAFSVRMRQQDVEVVVTEGVVEVMRNGSTERIAAERVARNQEVVVTSGQQPVARPIAVAALSETEVARRLAWQDGRLVFQGEVLADAVAEVNRYSTVPVVIDEPSLGRKSFVGVFRVGDTRAFAHAAAIAFDAQVLEEDGELHLRH